MPSIQCRGKEMLLTFFQNRDVEAWSIWDGKQFMFKGMGADELEATIDMLIQSNSNSCYMLKVYEDITEAKQIKSKTEADGSLNFVLTNRRRDENEYDVPDTGPSMGALQKRIENKMAAKIEKMMDAEEKPAEYVDDRPETIGEIMKNPDRMKEYLEVIGMIKNIFMPSQENYRPALIGNVTRADELPSSTDSPVYAADIQQRLVAAVNTLEKNDPKLLEHLEKLAKLSIENKPMFDNLLSMLEAM